MSALLLKPPYSVRDVETFDAEMTALHEHHIRWCPAFAGLSATSSPPGLRAIERLPFTHVGLFKRLRLVSEAPGSKTIRTVLSSSTGGSSSRIQLDEASSRLQATSSQAILADFIGHDKRPLLILDSSSSLRRRDEFSARIMAAMSLKPFASEVFFLLRDAAIPESLLLEQIDCALKHPGGLLVYGFSWILWQAWVKASLPDSLRRDLSQRQITFVHSGGWKKLEQAKVEPEAFDRALIESVGPGSLVVDYYGLVEQMGIIFPLCSHGSRHVPRWSEVVVRDSWTLEPLATGEGQLQLMNTLSWGSPTHNVLTEDMGHLLTGICPCGRNGTRFRLTGRVPRAELRGCANV